MEENDGIIERVYSEDNPQVDTLNMFTCTKSMKGSTLLFSNFSDVIKILGPTSLDKNLEPWAWRAHADLGIANPRQELPGFSLPRLQRFIFQLSNLEIGLIQDE